MKTALLAFTALFSILLATSCQKKPNASFTSSKDEYDLNELVVLDNGSSDAESYVWILTDPNGKESRSTASNFSFQASAAGSYEIRLAAYSRTGKYASKASKTITVRSTEGNILFYSTRASNYYQVYYNGVFQGGFSGQSGVSAPACGSIDAYTYKGTNGRYVFQVMNYYTSASMTYTLNITAGACLPQLVNF